MGNIFILFGEHKQWESYCSKGKPEGRIPVGFKSYKRRKLTELQ